MIPVIDVSRWQGRIDFRKMRRAGVQGVIVRLGNGVALDSYADEYVPAARAAELVVGSYWFMNPKATPTGAEQGRRLVDRARQLNALDIPPMLDIEDYGKEPGPYPSLRGQPLLNWHVDAAEMVRSMLGYSPIAYTNKSYTDNQGIAHVGELGRCPLIVARYPWYYAGNPIPPADASLWESWLYANTTKRPQVPVGFDGWQGWQFSAGYNRSGPAFGASSADIDMNLIKGDAWSAWTAVSSAVPAHPNVLDPPTVRPPVHMTQTEDEPDMPKYYVANSASIGSALITTTIDADGKARYTMVGFDDDETAEAWAGAYGTRDYSDARYQQLAAGASKPA